MKKTENYTIAIPNFNHLFVCSWFKVNPQYYTYCALYKHKR